MITAGRDITIDIAENCDQGVPAAYCPTIPRRTMGKVKVFRFTKKVQANMNSD